MKSLLIVLVVGGLTIIASGTLIWIIISAWLDLPIYEARIKGNE
jgi:hypothetical protein